jgi:uncharacterized protein
LAGILSTAHATNQDNILLQAVEAKDLDTVERALSNGANPNARNDRGYPALLVASLGASPAIVTALIESGADANLGTLDDGFTPLMAASARGDEEIVELLLSRNAKVDGRDNKMVTPLMGASRTGQGTVVSILLKHGADVNAKDASGATALMLGASQCRFDAVRELWSAGAKFDEKDKFGSTVLTYANRANCPLILHVVAAQPCKDMSSLYTEEELARWGPTFREEALEAQVEIEGQIVANKRELFSKTIIVMDPEGGCKNPFESIDSLSNSGKIDLPVLSLKFFRDLLFARRWLLENGYRDQTPAYVSMLKYRRAIDFPKNAYPPPFDALGIPHDKLSGQPFYKTPEARDQFQLVWKGVLFFFMAHEAGHIVSNWQGTPGDEASADNFAVELMSRSGQFPGGVVDLLILSGYFEPNGSDFKDLYQYRTWLRIEATHPLFTSRVNMLADSLLQHPDRYLHTVSPSNEQLAETKAISSDFKTRAAFALAATTFSDLFAAALNTDPSVLKPQRDSP